MPSQVLLDASKIEQVLNNLISNALKFSNAGTCIAVRVGLKEDSVVISVRDQGPGIPANELGRLFSPFARTSVKSPTGEKSTGLGLVIVKHIVEAHGGSISVESKPGRGTAFHVVLPLIEAPGRPAAAR